MALKLRRSLPRAVATGRWRPLALALIVSFLAVASLSVGFAWVAGGRIATIGGWTLLTLHAYLGLVLGPLLLLHLLPRRWRLLRPRWRWPRTSLSPRATTGRLSRRAVLAGGLLALGSVAAWAGAGALDLLRGGQRRFTGSRWLEPGGIPPPPTSFGESAPAIDPHAWRLTVRGRVARPASYHLSDLRRLGEIDRTAVLDCTSGWALETVWRGVPLAALLDVAEPQPGASRVEVRSATGWGAGLSVAEAREALLATGVAGQALPGGH